MLVRSAYVGEIPFVQLLELRARQFLRLCLHPGRVTSALLSLRLFGGSLHRPALLAGLGHWDNLLFNANLFRRRRQQQQSEPARADSRAGSGKYAFAPIRRAVAAENRSGGGGM